MYSQSWMPSNNHVCYSLSGIRNCLQPHHPIKHAVSQWKLYLSPGLARNIPFLIENITFYLQVHIVGSVAFDILLGRPFDILTESIIHNFSDGDQTYTIKDPNTGCIVTIPTIPQSGKSTPHHPQCHHR